MLYCITLLLSLLTVVTSSPNGAPSCESGTANVQSLHLSALRNPRTGDLSSNGFEVYLNGTLLESGNITSPTLFRAHMNNDLVVKAVNGTFRGILMLLYQPAVNVHEGEGLTPKSPLQAATGCAGTLTSGVTHTENSQKEEANAIIHYDTTEGVATLDINIVVANNDVDGSAYFFQKYYLQAFGEEEEHEEKKCGLFGLSFFCPFTGCGFFGRLLGLCRHDEDEHDGHEDE
jgi:hypothetical protein